MSKPKLTPYFDRDTKPARVGPYETTEPQDGSRTFQYWDGEKWGSMAFNPDESMNGVGRLTGRTSPRWRGLASPAEQNKEPA